MDANNAPSKQPLQFLVMILHAFVAHNLAPLDTVDCLRYNFKMAL